MRDRAAMFDLTAFCIFDVVGPGALDVVQQVATRQMDVPVGRVVYTPVLSRAALQVGPDDHAHGDETSASSPAARTGWRTRSGSPTICQRRPRGSTITRRSSARSGSGGRGRATSSRRSRATTSPTRASRSAPGAASSWTAAACYASRISYVGDLGWELYVPIEQGAKLWDALWEAGQPHGVVPAGIGVYGTTGRLEKCYRAFGIELDADYDVVEADMAWWQGEGRGLRRQGGARRAPRGRAGGDALHADGRRPHVGERREALHARPRADRDAGRRADHRREGPPLVRHERGRRAVDRQAHPDGVPAAGARARRREACRRVHAASSTRSPSTIVGSTPIFDPDNARIRS